nr:hypothetical protein P5630_07715 [Bacillus subtilis]
MSGFLIANTLLFLIVTAYAVYLFVYLVKTRLVLTSGSLPERTI